MVRSKSIQQIKKIKPDHEFFDERKNVVSLLTMHASKDLGFEQVLILACEDAIIPSAKSEEDEEKRLFYVACTRAKNNLTLTFTNNRYGKETKGLTKFIGKDYPSYIEFIKDKSSQAELKKRKLNEELAKQEKLL